MKISTVARRLGGITLPLVLLLGSVLEPGTGAAQNIEAGKEQKALTPELKPGDYIWQPEVSSAGPVAIIVSLSEQTLYVYRNGVEIGRAAIGGADAGRSYGNHVYAALDETNPDGGHRWNALGSLDGGAAPDIAELRKRLEIPPDFLAHLRESVTRGTTLVLTDQPVNDTVQSGPGFNVLNAGGHEIRVENRSHGGEASSRPHPLALLAFVKLSRRRAPRAGRRTGDACSQPLAAGRHCARPDPACRHRPRSDGRPGTILSRQTRHAHTRCRHADCTR